MKTLFTIISAVALLALSAIPTHAQSYGTASLSLTGIGTTAGGATTTVTNQIMDVRGFQNVSLQTKFNFASATTSNVVYVIAKSIDRTGWETVPSVTWTVAGTGTTDVIAVTTIATGGVGWLKLNSIQNTDGGIVLTNKSFQYSVKKNAP